MKYLLCLLPVILFIIFLIAIDSFKLIKMRIMLVLAAWGFVAAILAWFLNHYILEYTLFTFSEYSHYGAPFFEEILKVIVFLYIIKKAKAGFLIDGAIYGFTVGAFFGIFENLFYIYEPNSGNMMTWVIRGFGTAFMHGGATSIIMIFTMLSINTSKNLIVDVLKGAVIAVGLHMFYNLFIINPLVSTLLIMVCLPFLFLLLFRWNEQSLRKWLEVEMDTEVEMMRMIRAGKFSHTKSGEYLLSIKEKFSNEVVFDMLCYIQLYIELSLQAKSNMMLRETGFPISKDPNIQAKFNELEALKKNIGKTGLIAISPILRMSYKDLWKFNML
jgi:RsiW-degrading membrane proteinase PrsW (M82 family)